MDLSNTFDTIKHNLLITNFMHMVSQRISKTYVSNRSHRTKINKQFSSWQELIQGVPQGSSNGPLF